MCGIAGILSFEKPVDLGRLKAMTDAILHRGPDGEGHWSNASGTIGLGHRRLSIIDLSDLGGQPMHYAAGRYTITFNGEIYNYIELREQLILKGYSFLSGSDTEVLLAMYDYKKEKCLQDLDGMFSFAIWDEKEQTLFCARDRFGEKPFHYYSDEQGFVFASEIKQFWPAGIRKKIVEKRMQGFLDRGDVDEPNDPESTFYEGIKKLDAAHYLYIKKDKKADPKRYWEIETGKTPFKGSLADAAAEFSSLFLESVRLRLRSDVPVGSSLSGGLDSSSIVMLIDQLKGNSLEQATFSARFKNFSKDEGKYIAEVVKACKRVKEHDTWPDEAFFSDAFDKVTHYQDEPYGSASIVAQYAVMELAKKNNVTVLLDGQGADEYLAGYPSQYYTYLSQLFYNDRRQYKKEYAGYLELNKLNKPLVDLRKGESMRMMVGRYKRKVLDQPMPVPANALTLKLKTDTQTEGLKTLLRYADRNSMAHSREVRLPFLSHKLVEFAFSLPDSYKLRQGWTKYILRTSMEKILPADICWRKDKIGYEPPQESWLSSKAILQEVEKAARLFDVTLAKDANGRANSTSPTAWRLLMASRYI